MGEPRKVPKEMEECVQKYANMAAGVGVITGPFAHADIPVMVGIWVSMLNDLTSLSGRNLDKETSKRVALTVITAAGVAQAGIKTVTVIGGWLLALPTGGMSLAFSSAANGGINYKTTKYAGHEAAHLLIIDKLTAQEWMRATLDSLGLTFKGWGKGNDGPPDPCDFGL